MGGKKSLMKLKRFLVKLKWSLRLLQPFHKAATPRTTTTNDFEELLQRDKAARATPKGHFAVLAGEGEEEEKFVVELRFLRSPALLKLLDDAEEEYGFQQQGALVVPCKPKELEKILADNNF